MKLLHFRYVRAQPFQPEDRDLVKELQNLGLSIAWDYEYISAIPLYVDIKKIEEIFLKYDREYFITGEE